MADYFVASGGSNTSPYDTWAKAATSLATALAAATSAGDRVIIQYNGVPSGDAEVSADTTYTFAANISLIASTNSGTSTITPTAMGTSYWIGNSTTNRSITLAGARTAYIYGITLRTAGSVSDSLLIATTSGSDFTLDNCYLWHGNSNTGSSIQLGIGGMSTGMVRARDCTFRFGSTSQALVIPSHCVIEGGSLSAAGSIPTTLIPVYNYGALYAGYIKITGMDLSATTGTLVGVTAGYGTKRIDFSNCKFGAGVTVKAAETSTYNLAAAEVNVFNCASGDTHYVFGHYNALGSTIIETGIYANAGATYDGTNFHSWKIATTAYAREDTPYISPWIDRYHSGTSAITPSLEILRDGSSTAYTDAEIWSEWSYQGTSGYPIASFASDKRVLPTAAANQTTGALGASDWTGENATAWFGKLSPTSSITPAEIGYLRARVCFGKASSTVYVDPTIRGTS